MVSGPTLQDKPQTAEEFAKAEDTAIETAEQIARRATSLDLILEDGKKLTCRTAKVGHMGLVLKFIRKVAEQMQLISLEGAYLNERIELLRKDPVALLELFGTVEEFVWPVLVALTSMKSEAEAKNMDLDDAAKVAKVLFELNRDFFSQRVLPLLTGSLTIRESGQD